MECTDAVPCTLAARVFLARSRIYASCDVEASAHLRKIAEESAHRVGLTLDPRERISLFIATEPFLLSAFEAGRELRQEYDADELAWQSQADEQDLFPTVWIGEWQRSFDGAHETLPRVCQDGDRYIPQLEVSWMGGDPNISTSTAQPSLQAAIAADYAMDSRWHAPSYGADEDSACSSFR